MLALWLLLQLSPPPVTFTASVGSVTTGGLYTAPANASGSAAITVTAGGQTVVVPVTFVAPSIVTGVPYGPFGLWSSATTVAWGPDSLTASINASQASTVCTQIAAARAMRQKLILFMTGGAHSQYLTNGVFDFGKWTARMDSFNTAPIRACVSAGVADGTVIGNSMMDEPESGTPGADANGQNWVGMTRLVVNQMAAYARGIFPTLPLGVNHGPTGYLWRPSERYQGLDYVINQYAVRIGDLPAWRAAVLARATLDGVVPAFSINIYGGGTQDADARTGAAWDCPQSATGPYLPTCTMTATQIRTTGQALGPAGCFLVMWTYQPTMFARPDVQTAFRAIADSLARAPRRSCRRSG